MEGILLDLLLALGVAAVVVAFVVSAFVVTAFVVTGSGAMAGSTMSTLVLVLLARHRGPPEEKESTPIVTRLS